MDNVYSEIGIAAWDFVQISIGFLLTMFIFFGVSHKKKYLWLNYLCLITFTLQCLFLILFRNIPPLSLFAVLMLMTVVIVEVIVNKRRILHK